MKVGILVLIGNPMVIGKIVSSDVESYTVQNPINLHLNQKDGKLAPAFMNIVNMLSDDTSIRIPKSAVSYVMENVVDPLEKSYLEFVSGITIPSLIKG